MELPTRQKGIETHPRWRIEPADELESVVTGGWGVVVLERCDGWWWHLVGRGVEKEVQTVGATVI
jgi:hypothetical protein